MKPLPAIALLAALGLALWPAQAQAYIDPGSGSAIMSVVIGFIVAVGLAVKTYWYKLKSLFGLGSSSKAGGKDGGSGDTGA